LSRALEKPRRTVGIPGYTGLMPKVMVSMPDDLLAEVDAEARRTGSTRSAVLREFADAALRRRRERRAEAIRGLLDEAVAHGGHGGHAAEQVKATRPKL
jgi:metal-responsive CopG/Arc/MetJ family transcriptional regulator